MTADRLDWLVDAPPVILDMCDFELARMFAEMIENELPKYARGRVSFLQCAAFVALVRAVDAHRHQKEQAA